MVVISTPSSHMLPDAGSANRSILIAKVDFPDPVLPINPIFSPALTSKDPRKTAGRSGAYLISRFRMLRKLSPPLEEGQ